MPTNRSMSRTEGSSARDGAAATEREHGSYDYFGDGSAAQGAGDRRSGGAAGQRLATGPRRRAAEPLAASWEPDAQPSRARRGWLRRAVSVYGWRVYAVPVLLVITVLVLVDMAVPGGDGRGGDRTANGGAPAATEVPSAPADLNIPTAKLPEGGPITQQGKGSWHVVPGTGSQVGTGKLYTYTVEVEDGIDPAQYGGDQAFAKLVDSTLDSPKSWAGTGKVAVRRVSAEQDPDLRISLTTPKTDHSKGLCGYDIRYEASCYRSSEDRVVINLARWVRGASAFSGDMLTYRQYALNHEIGHAFGNDHVGCPSNGALAPVMMQQTFGVSNNYVAKLNRVEPSNSTAVPADGKTCRPNAWPDPQSRAGS